MKRGYEWMLKEGCCLEDCKGTFWRARFCQRALLGVFALGEGLNNLSWGRVVGC